MLTFEEMNALGQVIDTTWGKSSTAQSGSPQWSVKMQLTDDETIRVSYAAIVSFPTPNEVQAMYDKYLDESLKIIDQSLKRLREDFKAASGRNLKVKMIENHPGVEFITTSPHNPRKDAYFRNVAVCEIE